jgi:DNA repair exonuclease SbcCD ATPase subunit
VPALATMRTTSFLSARFFARALVLAMMCGCWAESFHAGDTEDYLTAEEVEQLREAQEPHLRLKVLGELLESRLEKAQAIKDPASIKPKTPEATSDKKNRKSDKPDVAAPAAKKTEPEESKPLLAWMEQYLRCLEELSDNVENFASEPLEPKAYLKSLNKLEKKLEEHTEWIDQIESKLDRQEKKVVAEILDVLEELTADLKAASEKAQEQIKLIKEAEKARSSRGR